MGDLLICAEAISLFCCLGKCPVLVVNGEIERQFANEQFLPRLGFASQVTVITLGELMSFRLLLNLCLHRPRLFAWQPGVNVSKLALVVIFLAPLKRLARYMKYLKSYSARHTLSTLTIHKRHAAYEIVTDVMRLLEISFPTRKLIFESRLESERSNAVMAAGTALVAPGSSSGEMHKRLSERMIEQIVEVLWDLFRLKTIILLGPSESDLKLQLISREGLNRFFEEGLEVVSVTSFEDLTARVKYGNVCITSCNFYGHYASFLGKPTISIYGPTDPMVTGIFGPQTRIIKSEETCSPCYSETCTRGCVVPRCMNDLSPAQLNSLIAYVHQFLGSRCEY